MNDNEVTKFDPSKLMDGVKDRIKATFVGLIPEEAWEGMVKKEVDAFFEPQQATRKLAEEATGDWNKKTILVEITEGESPFRRMVWDHCYELTRMILKEKISKEYFANTWSPLPEQLDERMKAMIKESAPLAMQHFFERLMMQVSLNVNQQIQNFR